MEKYPHPLMELILALYEQYFTCIQVERYGPYMAVHGYFTTYKRTVYGRNIGRRNTALS